MGGVPRAAAVLLLLAVLLAGAWRYGLYFDADYYLFAALIELSAACLLVFSAAVGRNARMDTGLARRREPGCSRWERLLVGWPFVLAACYLLHLARQPVSAQHTISEALRWSSNGAFFMLARYAASSKSGRYGLLLALQLTGGLIAWGGLACWLGWLQFPEALLASSNGQISALGYRLAGFFQYPNMLAAVLACFILWYLLQLARRPVGPLPGSTFLPAILLVPALTALLLTESRGGWLVAALGWLCALLALRGAARAALLRCTAGALLIAAALCRVLVQQGAAAQGHAAPTAGALAVALALCGAALLLALRQRQQPGSAMQPGSAALCRSGWAWAAQAAAGGAALWLLPPALGGRLGSGQYETAGARRLLYEDALRLWRESPWFGFGGGAWRVQFERIQQQPYVGSRVHSAYLDMALDLGALGFLLLAAALLLCLLAVRRRSGFVMSLPPLMLLVHGAADFDNAFGFYWLLLLAYIALYSCQPQREDKRDQMPAPPDATVPGPTASMQALVPPAANYAGRARLAAGAVNAILLLGLALGTGTALCLHLAQAAYASSGGLPLPQRIAKLEHSLSLNPYELQTRLALARLLEPSARLLLLEEGLRSSPQSSHLLWEAGVACVELRDWRQAAAYLEQALQRDHYNKDRQTEAILQMERLARQFSMEGKRKESGEAAAAALAFYERYEQLALAQSKLAHPANDRRFELTLLARQYAEYSRRLLQAAAASGG